MPKSNALWVDHALQCGDSCPDDRHSCTIEREHPGAHVAIDPMFGSVLAAWPGEPTIERGALTHVALRFAGKV